MFFLKRVENGILEDWNGGQMELGNIGMMEKTCIVSLVSRTMKMVDLISARMTILAWSFNMEGN